MVRCCSVRTRGIPSTFFVLNRLRGAVIRGQEGNQVESRIARCNYGIELRIPFDSKKHRADEDLEWCPYEEKWKLNRRMRWYILKVSNFQCALTNP
jgi:hypothetical protein